MSGAGRLGWRGIGADGVTSSGSPGDGANARSEDRALNGDRGPLAGQTENQQSKYQGAHVSPPLTPTRSAGIDDDHSDRTQG
jgi:hypothetical protein